MLLLARQTVDKVNLIQMGLFGAAHGQGDKEALPP